VGASNSGELSWRVFVSYTSELRDFPHGGSYVAAVKQAISSCGHVAVDMSAFPAADLSAAELCRESVRSCAVYVGLLGTRYGSPVRECPQISYTELEYDTATQAGLPRLAFLLDRDAAQTGIPAAQLIDLEFGARQEEFRRRVQAGAVTQSFTDPGSLGQLVERSLRELERRRQPPVVPGEISRERVKRQIPAGAARPLPVHFERREDLLSKAKAALLRQASTGAARMVGLVGMGGAGKSVLARDLARDKQVQLAFHDGIVWLDFGPNANVAGRQADLAEAFGDYRAAVDWRQRLKRLNDLLAGASCLVILDDVWERRHLEYFDLSEPRSALLVTARDSAVLDYTAEIQRVTKLPAQTARRLLAAWAGVESGALPAPALEVAEQCDGLPLALAIAGAMARRHNWRHISERIRAANLDSLKINLPDYREYEDLFRVLDASVSCLPENYHDGYLALAIFEGRGDVPVEVAFRLWRSVGLSCLDAEDLLIELDGASLLQRNETAGTFTLHALQYVYARHQLGVERLRALHELMADGILVEWGELDHGLPGLLASRLEGAAERYGVLNLAAHLEAAGRDDDIHRLLALDSPAVTGQPDQVRNAWFTAHEHIGETVAYSADVRLAWNLAKASADGAFGAAELVAGIGLEIRYALIAASIASITSRIPARLIASLVADGYWTAGQGLKHARLLPAGEAKSEALVDLLAYVNTVQRADVGPSELAAEIAAEVSAAARVVDDPGARASIVTALAALVPVPDRGAAVSEAWAAVSAIPQEYPRANGLARLAAAVRLPKALRDEALRLADKSGDPRSEAVIRTALAPQFPAGERPEIVSGALAAIDAIPGPAARFAALVALLPCVIADERAAVASRAIEAAAAVPAGGARASAFIALAGALPKADRDPALNRAREEIDTITAPEEKAAALIALVPMTSSPVGAEKDALPAIEMIGAPEQEAAALTALISKVAPARRQKLVWRALDPVRLIDDPQARAHHLIALVAMDSQSSELQEEAAAAIGGISQSAARAAAYTDLAGHLLPGPRRSDMLGRALAAASAIDDAGPRATGLAAMIPRLPGWDNPAAELDGRRTAAQALSDARAALWSLSLPITAAALAPALPEADRRSVLSEATVAAYQVRDPGDRATVLTALIPRLAEPGRSQAISRACAAAREIRDPDLRQAALSGVQSAAPEALRQQAEGVTRAVETVLTRLATLNTTLAACGRAIEDHPATLPAILADPALVASAGALLPPDTPEQQRTAISRCAQQVTEAIGDLGSRAAALLIMAAVSFGRAAGVSGGPAASRAIARAWLTAGGLDARLPELPGALDDEVRAAVRAIRDANSWAARTPPESASIPPRARAGQPPPSSQTQHAPAGFPPWQSHWRALIDSAAARGRAALIADLSAMGSTIAQVGGSAAIQETTEALLDVGCWWP
jgi:hypothetical protein